MNLVVDFQKFWTRHFDEIADDKTLKLWAKWLWDTNTLWEVDFRRIHLLINENPQLKDKGFKKDSQNGKAVIWVIMLLQIHLRNGHVSLPMNGQEWSQILDNLLENSFQRAMLKLEIGGVETTDQEKLKSEYQSLKELNQDISYYNTQIDEFLSADIPGLSGKSELDSSANPILIVNHNNTHTVYWSRYRKAELSIVQTLKGFLQKSSVEVQSDELSQILQDVHIDNALYLDAQTKNTDAPKKLIMHYRQRVAVALACLKPLTLITGGPGTGKTTVVAQLLRSLRRLYKLQNQELSIGDIALVAPTGRAAARLQESLQNSLEGLDLDIDKELNEIEGSTVHRLLKYRPNTGTFVHNAQNPLSQKVVILDESSMLDVHLFSALLSALNQDCRLVLLGDRNQLPSVESGAVLGDLSEDFYTENLGSLSAELFAKMQAVDPWNLECENPDNCESLKLVGDTQNPLKDHVVILNKSYRSVQTILELAEKINQSSPDGIAQKQLLANKCSLSEVAEQWQNTQNTQNSLLFYESPKQNFRKPLEEMLKSWTEIFYGSEYKAMLKQIGELAQNEFPGVLVKNDQSNQSIQSEWFTKLDYLQNVLDSARVLCLRRSGERGVQNINQMISQFFGKSHGTPVIITRNDRTEKVFNGDTGVMLELAGKKFLSLKRPEGFRLIPEHQLPEYQTAFAMTIHKSQGSEFTQIIMLLPETKTPLLTREILYTGLTRAKKQATLIGETNLFQQGCEQYIKRDSGIAMGIKKG